MPIDLATGLDDAMGISEEMMACPTLRVPLIEPGTETGELVRLYDESRQMWGTVPRYLQLMAHVPAGVEAWNLLDRELRLKRLSSDPEYVILEELAIIKTSLMNKCNNCTGHNVELGRSLGLTDEQIIELSGDEWRRSTVFGDKQKVVIAWAEAVTDRSANGNEEVFAGMRRHFDDTRIVELTLIIAMWNLSNRFAEALHLVVEPPGARITFQ